MTGNQRGRRLLTEGSLVAAFLQSHLRAAGPPPPWMGRSAYQRPGQACCFSQLHLLKLKPRLGKYKMIDSLVMGTANPPFPSAPAQGGFRPEPHSGNGVRPITGLVGAAKGALMGHVHTDISTPQNPNTLPGNSHWIRAPHITPGKMTGV